MNPNVTLAAVLVLAAALVVAPVAAAVPSGGPAATYAAQETETPDAADENASVAPGERLSGAVGVQQAELEGEMQERTFGVKVAKANTDGAKAGVVADQLDDVEERLDELEQRKQRLEEARENGSMGEGEYRAKMAKVAAETENAKRMANASEETAGELPAETLEANGVDVEAIQTLRDRAENLSGPEVAEIAQSIAGKDAGKSMAGDQRPEDVADQIPGDAGNRTDAGEDGAGDQAGQGDRAGDRGSDTGSAVDRADQEVTSAQERVAHAEEQVADGGDEAQAALERAQENLTAAEDALADAREARDNGEDDRAAELADEALAHAEAALEHAQAALDAAGNGAGGGGNQP